MMRPKDITIVAKFELSNINFNSKNHLYLVTFRYNVSQKPGLEICMCWLNPKSIKAPSFVNQLPITIKRTLKSTKVFV